VFAELGQAWSIGMRDEVAVSRWYGAAVDEAAEALLERRNLSRSRERSLGNVRRGPLGENLQCVTATLEWPDHGTTRRRVLLLASTL
jgi:hypothetical protein